MANYLSNAFVWNWDFFNRNFTQNHCVCASLQSERFLHKVKILPLVKCLKKEQKLTMFKKEMNKS